MMIKKKILPALALTASALLVLVGCTVGGTATGGGGEGEGSGDAVFAASQQVELFEMIDSAQGSMEGKRVAYVPIMFEGHPLLENWYQSVALTLENQGAEVKVYDPNFDTDVMVKMVDDIIAKKSADILIVQNPDVGVLANQIGAAAEAGIYTILLNMASNTMGDALVMADQVQAGKDVTERAIADCKANGDSKQLHMIYGPGSDAVSMQFDAGAKAAADEAGFEITYTATSWQQTEAQEAASNALQQYKGKICGFLVAFDVNSMPVGDEVQAAVARGDIAQGEVGVYTFGGDHLWCDAIRSGKVTATAAYNVDGLGQAVASAAQELVQRGEPAGSKPTVSFVAHKVVDATNIDKLSFSCYQGLLD